MTGPTTFTRLTTFALLISLGFALLVFDQRPAKAATATTTVTAGKVSPDLRQLIDSGNGDQNVKVIVQHNSSGLLSGGLIGSLLQTVGGVLDGLLLALNISLVRIQAN